MDLTGKVAIITGSGGAGCGRAIARRFAREGCSVVVSDIDEPGGHETVRLIEAGQGRAAFLRADLAKESDIKALIEFAEKTYGGLDVLVNNAGAPYRPQGLLDNWFHELEVDLHGPMYAILHAIPAMRKRHGGAIVNMGSTSAIGHGLKHSKSPGYDVAKMGLIRLTTTLAPLQASDGIRVNCLVPAWIASPEVKSYVDSLTPQQRKVGNVPEVLITLDQIASAVVHLATDETFAGRLMLYFNGESPRLIAPGDPGWLCDINVEPFEGVDEPRPAGSDATSTASSSFG
jgi:NAD(P)-dependent dehydrogenase (short-subunit alcohol dehydrogenase family)